MANLKFRKRPVEIEAFRFTDGASLERGPDWMREALKAGRAWYQGGVKPYLTIGTLEGAIRANSGDWIIRGVEGELYPCKPQIFAATYEAVEETHGGVFVGGPISSAMK